VTFLANTCFIVYTLVCPKYTIHCIWNVAQLALSNNEPLIHCNIVIIYVVFISRFYW
jgi:hypothetical protein